MSTYLAKKNVLNNKCILTDKSVWWVNCQVDTAWKARLANSYCHSNSQASRLYYQTGRGWTDGGPVVGHCELHNWVWDSYLDKLQLQGVSLVVCVLGWDLNSTTAYYCNSINISANIMQCCKVSGLLGKYSDKRWLKDRNIGQKYWCIFLRE